MVSRQICVMFILTGEEDAQMSLESDKDAPEPQQWLTQWNMDGGVPPVLQKICQPGTVNGQLRIIFTLLSSAREQGV
jgi:hypothetical protein